MTMPESVGREEFVAAIKPLMDLLGTNSERVHSGMRIGWDEITFTVAASDDVELRPRGIVPTAHPQGNDHSELAYLCRVEIR
jgi:hypothetical protein